MSKILNAGSSFINRYIIPLGEDGYCLFDTGYKWSYKEFCEKLNKCNVKLEDIKYVVITHMHADHTGFLKELLTHIKPTLIYDFDDRKRLEAGKNNLNTYISGFWTLVASKFSVAFVDLTQVFPAVFYDKVLDAKTQPLADYGVEFISLKGHTECDICALWEGILFCGDLCMSGIGATKHSPMWIFNKYDMVESWRTIVKDERIKTLYPAHGKPFERDDLLECIDFWQAKGVFRLYSKK